MPSEAVNLKKGLLFWNGRYRESETNTDTGGIGRSIQVWRGQSQSLKSSVRVMIWGVGARFLQGNLLGPDFSTMRERESSVVS